MWIALNDGFFSIVEDKKDRRKLLIRARLRGDLERVWGPDMRDEGASVAETPQRDYRFRTILSRTAVAAKIAARLAKIDYTNFKASVENNDLAEMYADIWQAASEHQEAT